MTSRKHCLVKHTDVSGCQMFPVPSMADILMDLYCENVPFHQGHAHQGMAAACNNILAMVDIYTITLSTLSTLSTHLQVLDTLAERLQQWPDYKLVILGYSLGAGVAELLTIELTKVDFTTYIIHACTVPLPTLDNKYIFG